VEIGIPVLTTCSSCESGDSSGATGTSCTSGEVVKWRLLSRFETIINLRDAYRTSDISPSCLSCITLVLYVRLNK